VTYSLTLAPESGVRFAGVDTRYVDRIPEYDRREVRNFVVSIFCSCSGGFGYLYFVNDQQDEHKAK
jgi:hypothetical protein